MRGDSARKALVLDDVGVDGLAGAFSDEVHFGERVGLVGPNGGGKTHLMRAFAGDSAAHTGEVRIGYGLADAAQRSYEALEAALEGFEGTVVAVSHDRAFLRRMDRFLTVCHDGSALALPDYDSASEALLEPDAAAGVRLAKTLTRR